MRNIYSRARLSKCLIALSIVSLLTACGQNEDTHQPGLDSTPDSIDFSDQSNVASSTVVQSERVTVSGFNVLLDISISGDAGAEYSLCDAASASDDQSACDQDTTNFTATARKIRAGQTVRVRVTSGAGISESTSATLTLTNSEGTVVASATFSVTTGSAPDTTPDQFTFTDKTDQAPNVAVLSTDPVAVPPVDPITISGINTAAPISISGDPSATYSIDGGGFTNANGTIMVGQTVAVQVTSSGSASGIVTATLNVGGVTDVFSVTTSATVDSTPPTVSIVFPFTDGLLTDGDTVIVRGTASDADSSVTGVTVSVGGAPVNATTSDGFANWQATLPGLAVGNNTITATATDTFANNGNDTVDLTRYNEVFVDPDGVAVDGSGNVIVVNSSVPSDNLISFPAGGGALTLVSGNGAGSGTDFGDPRAVAVNGTTAYVADEELDAIISVDLTTGARTVLSEAATPVGTGPAFDAPHGIAFDTTRLVVADSGVDALIAVDLASGNRTILSQSGVMGTGDAFDDLFSVVVVGTTAYAADQGLDRIWQVDLITGNRVDFSDADTPDTNNVFGNAKGLAYDAAGNRLIVTDPASDQIVAVALAGTPGARTILSDNSSAAGPRIADPAGVTIDAAGTSALYVDTALNIVTAVDLTTGARSIFGNRTASRGGTTVGVAMPRKMVIDTTTTPSRLLVSDSQLNAVLAIDTTTGVRTILSDLNNGTTSNNADFTDPVDIVLDTSVTPSTRAIVNNLGTTDATRGLITVDLVNGDRDYLSVNSVANGSAQFDTGGQGEGLEVANVPGLGFRALVGRSAAPNDNKTVMEVDLTTGAREQLFARGSNPSQFGQPKHFTVDATNLYVADQGRNRVIQVPLDGSARTVIATRQGNNGYWGGLRASVLDSTNNRLLVVSTISNTRISSLVSVDITASEMFSLITTSDTNPSFVPANADEAARVITDRNLVNHMRGVALIPGADNMAFVSDSDISAILVVDLTTGERLRFSQ